MFYFIKCLFFVQILILILKGFLSLELPCFIVLNNFFSFRNKKFILFEQRDTNRVSNFVVELYTKTLCEIIVIVVQAMSWLRCIIFFVSSCVIFSSLYSLQLRYLLFIFTIFMEIFSPILFFPLSPSLAKVAKPFASVKQDGENPIYTVCVSNQSVVHNVSCTSWQVFWQLSCYQWSYLINLTTCCKKKIKRCGGNTFCLHCGENSYCVN